MNKFSDMGRPKKNNFLQDIQNAQKKRNDETCETNSKESEAGTTGVSAAEEFEKNLSLSNPADRLGEFNWFERNLPLIMHPKDKGDLIREVETHLRVQEASSQIVNNRYSSHHLHGMEHPLLDSLSCKLGIGLKHVLAPPVVSCLLCRKTLTRNNKPTVAALHTLNGKNCVFCRNNLFQLQY